MNQLNFIYNINNCKNNYQKKNVVITFGTFDLYHLGHENILSRAKKYGDYLVVGVSSDWLNLTKKGVSPVDNQEKRINKVLQNKNVDEVFIEESLEKKLDYIKKYNAKTLVMGDDWKNKFNYMGIKSVYLPRTPDISSTLIKQKYYNNNINNLIIKNKLKLNGTYLIPLVNKEEIFPLKKYKFYNYELYGPNKFNAMKKYYEKYCPMMTHAYAKWAKPKTVFKITDFKPHKFNYDDMTDFDYNHDGIFCTKNTKACVHTPNKYIFKNNKVSIRRCCRNKVNRILIDTCKFLEKAKIPYFIYWGTLLGTIRHGGSIPWDTDHDLYILDKDYSNLLNKIKESKLIYKYYLSQVNKYFLRINFSKKNRIHLDIYIAQQFD